MNNVYTVKAICICGIRSQSAHPSYCCTGRIILNWIFPEIEWTGCSGLILLVQEPMAGSNEHGDKLRFLLLRKYLSKITVTD